MSVEAMYQQAVNTPSDIHEHLPVLRALASECKHVTEFGTRTGVSTIALLAAQPETLITYDIVKAPEMNGIAANAGRTKFIFRLEDVEIAKIEDTDMLFQDTKHTGQHVYKLLQRHAAKVRKYIAFHDTVSCAERDPWYPDEGGIVSGIDRYMKRHPEWRLLKHYPNCNGLTVYERV
jgi:hypothetical protein